MWAKLRYGKVRYDSASAPTSLGDFFSKRRRQSCTPYSSEGNERSEGRRLKPASVSLWLRDFGFL